jgi:multidrug efflux pump subunit AcrB
MDSFKAFLLGVFNSGIAILMTPWMMVMGIKLAFWPHLLTEREAETILALKNNKEEFEALRAVVDFVVIGVLSWFSPLWLGVFLWIAFVVSYLFTWQVKSMVLPDEESGEDFL